jgi:hypothetical protein
MRENWIRYGEGFFLVYSIDSQLSFEKEITPLLRHLERVRDADITGMLPSLMSSCLFDFSIFILFLLFVR